ncbi:MAG: homoserine dehydrogenase, partial [Nitrospinota bacterium]|nr:homoserine dehydrogenase [Nitrospinota bacterium]
EDPNIDIVAELIGGLEDARKYLLKCFDFRKPVVTANKAVLAVHGEEIFSASVKADCPIGFEASIAGSIPIVRNIRESFASDKIREITGILNGTSNYILTEMTENNVDFSSTLENAQKLGYAEADPSFDIDGIDSAHKIAILANIAFGSPVGIDSFTVEGIRNIDSFDIQYATELGYRIKLIAIAKETEQGLDVRVHPALLPNENPIAQVNGVLNAVSVTAAYAGRQVFIGRGAGADPTASAVVSDIIELARNKLLGTNSRVPAASFLPNYRKTLKVLDSELNSTKFYLRLSVLDSPGVLSEITGLFSEKNISIETVLQKGKALTEGYVPLIIMTHKAIEKDMSESLMNIMKLKVVNTEYSIIRVESNDARFREG